MSGADIAVVAKVIANPTSADVLDALLSERKLTVGALAAESGRARSTVSAAVSALAAAGLVHREVRGRVTLVELAGHEVAEVLESLGRLAGEPPIAVGLREVNRMQAVRRARTCYDHLAGRLGVELADRLLDRGVLADGADGSWRLTEPGRRRLTELGVDAVAIGAAGRRPLIRSCQDWTERRPHVAGRVGAAICTLWLQRGLVQRIPRSRAVRIDPAAAEWLAEL